MKKSLIIVESPTKAKTISKYLGDGFEVKASVGHIIDLPSRTLGVNIEDNSFTPQYEPISNKAKVIKEIVSMAKKVDNVYLASDPDREGEAIAYHIGELIKDSIANSKKNSQPKIYRLRFHEITKSAIKKSIENPDTVNMDLFYAQQARRILDRLVGYQISPLLWKKVCRGLSAGRVQSVAVKLIVDRQKEIDAFKSEEYWSILSNCQASQDPSFQAKLIKTDGKKSNINNQDQASAVKKEIVSANSKVINIDKKQRKRKAPPPFTTSKLQQDAARAFGFTAKRTMQTAQKLYEGIDLESDGGQVGLITYMRTDSVNVSKEALVKVRNYIKSSLGDEYLPQNPHYFKGSKRSQEAHEAVRPTSLELSPDKIKSHLSLDQYKLYKLIWRRFVASQIKEAIYDQTKVDIEAGRHQLRASGSILKFDGYLKIYQEQYEESEKNKQVEEDGEGNILPPIVQGENINIKDVITKQHFTQPPPCFNEATLVKELEEKGIGRPSTYASILSTIQEKGYVEKQDKKFIPTEVGDIVSTLLADNFPVIMEIAFTALMEEKLDKVEDGAINWHKLLDDFYTPFAKMIFEAEKSMVNIKRMEEKTDVSCPKCGNYTVIKWGKNGSFLGCSDYPSCNFTSPYKKQNGKVILQTPPEIKEKCPKCSAQLIHKKGRYGNFIGCSRYPDCNFTMAQSTGATCPNDGCDGAVVQKRSKRGKTFYGCSHFPKCDFVSWNLPVNKKCLKCDSKYLEKKITKKATSIVCPSCKSTFDEEEIDI